MLPTNTHTKEYKIIGLMLTFCYTRIAKSVVFGDAAQCLVIPGIFDIYNLVVQRCIQCLSSSPNTQHRKSEDLVTSVSVIHPLKVKKKKTPKLGDGISP